jgi:nucleoside-diphosphate-sugar epimerase
MNILVTGATGFIGRYLVNALCKNHQVRCLVRKTSDISMLRNINVAIVYGDLLVKNSLDLALDKIDLIYHLAGEVYSRKRNDYFNGNVLASKNLVEVAKEKEVKRMIFLSSLAVYKPVKSKTLLTEESECAPIALYGKTKLSAERLIKESGIPSVVIRAPVVYGPHQPQVMNRIFAGAIKNKKVTIIGNGEKFRSLCYVTNLVEGLISLIDHPNVQGKTYILSDDRPYTLNELIGTISKVLNQKIKIVYLPNILGDILWKLYGLISQMFNLYFVELYGIKTMQLHLGCDITKAKREIAYNPSVSIEAGVQHTIRWIETCL